MSLAPLVVGIEADINLLRRLLAYVKSSRFDGLYDRASDAQQSVLREHIRAKRYSALKEYVTQVESTLEIEYEDVPVERLRIIASSLGVTNYTRMQKDELIQRIRENESVQREHQFTQGSGPVGGLGRQPG